MDYQHLSHPFPALWDEHSRILILGSFPSVKSREAQFFYGHPQNRFWKVIAAICQEEIPSTIPEKSALLHRNHIALWDVIQSCDIIGSSDSSIKNVVPNNLSDIVEHSKVRVVFNNGRTSHKLYQKYTAPGLVDTYGENFSGIYLPSTSPANASWTVDKLVKEWSLQLKSYLEERPCSET